MNYDRFQELVIAEAKRNRRTVYAASDFCDDENFRTFGVPYEWAPLFICFSDRGTPVLVFDATDADGGSRYLGVHPLRSM